jgi:hypothetical protein
LDDEREWGELMWMGLEIESVEKVLLMLIGVTLLGSVVSCAVNTSDLEVARTTLVVRS